MPPKRRVQRHLDLLARVSPLVWAYTENTCSWAQERKRALGQARLRLGGMHRLEKENVKVFSRAVISQNESSQVSLVLVWVSPSVVCVRHETPLFCSSGLQSTALFFRLLAGEGIRAADSLSDRGSLSGALGCETG